ncbi:E3 ubiquitin-protein ligase XIAP isoform 2-T2 [Aplochiton taeniatus]
MLKMAGLRRDSDQQADHAVDWSMMHSRLDSFRGSPLAQQVSAERLARAGFYFTGQADRVRCFSCKKTVENWCGGDTPVERHKEVSPSCKFLSCTHRATFPGHLMGDTSPYNEEAEDMEFRLRSGEVVDESTYPIAPHMSSEDTRLQTFSLWPPIAPVRPRDLAEAGLYCLGEGDRVQCFCCGGVLGGWEAGDTAWGEHSKHFPHCFFILGHDVSNVPSHRDLDTDGEVEGRGHTSTRVLMENFEDRLNSFVDNPHSIDHERLARAGFHSTGAGDRVTCFSCGGGLKGWQPEEDPWEEHAKFYPGCGFLLSEKGQEFISRVQLQDPRRNSAGLNHQNGFSSHDKEGLRSAMTQKAIEMGLEPSLVERTVQEKIQRTGSDYSNLEALLHDCFNKTPDTNVTMAEEQCDDPLEKLRKLQKEKLCKVCMDRDICIVFIPCGHLVTCKECSEPLSKCPICCGAISQKIKTYIS